MSEIVISSDALGDALSCLIWLIFPAALFIGERGTRRKVRKPTARVLDGNTLVVTGDVGWIQKAGVPGAGSWEHTGNHEWKLHLNTMSGYYNTAEAQSVADLINSEGK